ncbi:MAG: hypothetical protein KatS3mg105_5016 [Gemmatales bacterium]|nr:MAG: hypothetical protein KatS3mg105_5016 [Gemmatales bacterium]
MKKRTRRSKDAPRAALSHLREIDLRTDAQVDLSCSSSEESRTRRFQIIAYTGGPMSIDSFDAPVVVDLSGLDFSKQRIPILYDHIPSIDHVIGQSDSISIENGKLVARGRFVLDKPDSLASAVLAKADSGYVWQASIGAMADDIEYVDENQTIAVNGSEFQGPLYLVRRARLREISFVVLGGDASTSAIAARSKLGKSRLFVSGGMQMTFEEWLLSLGFEDQASLTEVQLANLKLLFDEHVSEGESAEPSEDEAGDSTDAVPAEEGEAMAQAPVEDDQEEEEQIPTNGAMASAARILEIQAICESYGNPKTSSGIPLSVHAIANRWTPERVRKEISLINLRASRRVAPNGFVRSTAPSIEALQGALLLRCGVRCDSKVFRKFGNYSIPSWLRLDVNSPQFNQVMEASHRLSSYSILDMCRTALQASGRPVPLEREEMIRAAFSTGSMGAIFTTSVNASLLMSYFEAPDTTAEWTRTVDVTDFKEQERVRVETGPGLKLLPRGATADHASFEANVEKYKIYRFARMFQIDEQDIIDDNLSALSDTPMRFGIAAARLRPDLVYSLILSNPTLNSTGSALFSAAHGNNMTTAALSAAKLREAVKNMMLFKENGVNLNVNPTHILVPPSLRHLAYELTNSSQILIATGATTLAERGNINALAADGLVPISEPRLENGVRDPKTEQDLPGSADRWYLVSTDIPTVEVAYRAGTGRAPVVRSYMLDRGQFGIGWDVSLDIGAAVIGWAGLLRASA